MALSSAWRHSERPLSSPGGTSRAARRLSCASSSAAIHCASNSWGTASTNSSDASIVSGVPGSHLVRRRAASSLTKAVRGAKPKSASKVVMSTVSTSCAHHACRRARNSGRASTASRKSCSLAVAPGTESRSPRTHSSKWMSQRWRWGRSASASSSASRRARSLGRLNAAPFRSGARQRGHGEWPPARKGERAWRKARRLRPRSGTCRAWCRWPCAGGTRWCIERLHPA